MYTYVTAMHKTQDRHAIEQIRCVCESWEEPTNTANRINSMKITKEDEDRRAVFLSSYWEKWRMEKIQFYMYTISDGKYRLTRYFECIYIIIWASYFYSEQFVFPAFVRCFIYYSNFLSIWASHESIHITRIYILYICSQPYQIFNADCALELYDSYIE